MAAHLNIVVTCSNRKRLPVPAELQLRNVGSKALAVRAAEWIGRLESTSTERCPAIDLYGGDHWTVVRDLRNVALGASVELTLWVCSAGYGLFPVTAKIKPYAATFSARQPDSVVRSEDQGRHGQVLQQWWNCVSEWRGPCKGEPRTIAEIARSDRDSPLMIVASNDYVKALAKDLIAASDSLRSRELLTIVSAGTDSLDGLSNNLLPADARFETWLEGSRQSLNVRLAREIIRRSGVWGLQTFRLKSELTKRLEAGAMRSVPAREPRSDDEVRTFIVTKLGEDPKAKHSTLLRKLRDRGARCEQGRFRILFFEVRAELLSTQQSQLELPGSGSGASVGQP